MRSASRMGPPVFDDEASSNEAISSLSLLYLCSLYQSCVSSYLSTSSPFSGDLSSVIRVYQRCVSEQCLELV
jgi:hypothetical protein